MAGRIRTLCDLDLLEGSSSAAPSTGRVPAMTLHHIPNLSDAEACQRMLQRIHREFYPIIERRGYRVLTLSEMCCCGDGLDHDHESNNNNNNKSNKRKRKRKLRTMGLNVLGYNVTHRNRTHAIHLRLRDSRNHGRLFPYEDVAGTMAHELAHCVHGPHNAKFYKLMDEILEQHAVFMARGIVADSQGFPMNSEQAYTLGTRGDVDKQGRATTTKNGTTHSAAGPAQAALTRQQRSKWMPQGPQKLGGDEQFRSWLAPGEAAGMAAEARRLRDEQWCQPCSDIVELSSDDSDDETETETNDDTDDRKPAADDSSHARNDGATKQVAIDLTASDDDCASSTIADSSNIRRAAARLGRKSKKSSRGAGYDTNCSPEHSSQKWACRQCTFINIPLSLACGVCGLEANSAEQTMKVAKAILRADEIEHFKEMEVERAEKEFGFNIYGMGSRKSGTMSHLT